MKRKGEFYVLVSILFLIIISTMFYFNRVNREEIRSGFEAIVSAEGTTIKDLIAVSGRYLVQEGKDQLYAFLEQLYENENVIYIGVTEGKDLVFLNSRFEGYFPVAETKKPFRAFKSPIGRIFEINSSFTGIRGHQYKLYIGFNYEFITTFEDNSKKNFLMIMAVILVILIFLIIFIIRYDRRNYLQHLKYLHEKEDKEHFQELSLLTSEIAHEIKNPLNSLYLSFSTIEKYIQTEDEDAVFYKKAIKGEIRRISEIINSYSSVSKKIRINLKKIDVKRFLKDFALIKERELSDLGIQLEIENSIRHLVSDQKLLTQVLLNLVNNAIDAKAKKIEIKLSRKDGLIEILVNDDGEAISEEIREQIFKPYISSKMKGMGLGLHITLKILKTLKGRIELLSANEGNKSFRIHLNSGGKRG